MWDLLVCRVCLAWNVPVYDILHTRYQDALERITSISIAEASKPHALCAPCLDTVDKCCKLQERSAAAEALLTRLLQQKQVIQQHPTPLQEQLTEETIKSIDRQQHKLADILPNFSQLVPMSVNVEVPTENIMIKVEPLDTLTQDLSDIEQGAPSRESSDHKVSIETVKVKETPYIQIDAGKLSAVKTEVDDTYVGDLNVPDPLADGLVQIEVEMAETEYNALLENKNSVKELMIGNPRASKDGDIGKKTAKLKSKSDVEAYLKKCSIDNRRLKPLSCGECETNCEHKPLVTVVKPCPKQNTGESYDCSECEYQTYSRKNLMYHMKKHTDNLVICATCGYKCATKSRLVSHIRIHTKERPYECKVCGKRFSEPGSLSKHLKHLHKGVKAFKCMWCDYGAATKSHLDRHVQRHTGDKRWKCELCDYACVQKWDLKRHVKTHENDRMRYKRVAPVIVRIVSMAEEK